jgi:epoxyqueuosine reductase QueG
MKKEIISVRYDQLKKYCLEKLGIDLFGVADIREIRENFILSGNLVTRYDYAISLGKEVLLSILDDIQDSPTSLYFHHYRQLNIFLDRAALKLASRLTAQGYLALPIAASQVIDWKNQRAHLSHKKIGELAGLGWLGRNNLLVNRELGSRFRLVTVLTNLPLKADTPVPFSCGDCHRCLAVCPAQAIRETPAEFNHTACFEKLKEFRNRGLVGQYICGICVKACYGHKKIDDYAPSSER